MTSPVTHADMRNAIAALAMDAVEKAKSGHPGMPMGMADVATVLFRDFLRYDPQHPHWPDRDRFILSAGHGSMLLYALLYLTGYPDMTLGEIRNFRQWGAKTAGHPEYGHATGIETTTGPLGQGISNAVGFAMAERALNAEFGDALVNHTTYVIAGDGCLMEGISHEAASLAGHLALNKLVVLWDDNRICIDGPTDMTVTDDQCARFTALGWNTLAIDGHDEAAIRAALTAAQTSDKPMLIACRTRIAKGAPTKEGKNSSHGSPLGAEEIAGARKNLGWEAAPFEIPADILAAWREAAVVRATEYAAWETRFAASTVREAFSARVNGDLGEAWVAAVAAQKQQLAVSQPKEATRVSSQNALEVLVPQLPSLLGGSADLTGSNNTKTKAMKAFSAGDYAGRYVYYGVREHAMAAAMNGIALHGGFVPYGGTFLVFTDYCRPAIRLSALMEQRVIYVMTHDSIGLGEDGPTHQPVEHLAVLRAIPNLHVFRPCDATETLECWQLAVGSPKTPSILALTRQALPHYRNEYAAENLCAKGAYILRESTLLHSPFAGESNRSCDSVGGASAVNNTPPGFAEGANPAHPQGVGKGSALVVLMATGSEVMLAVEAQAQLEAKGIATRVVSVPCMELFMQQSPAYRASVLGEGVKRIAIEAAIEQGWEKLLGENGTFIGMQSFGASAPAEVLYEKFGITVDAIVAAAG
ncbi:MAG: transketolase [Alphaproteobacteria bacterium]|nr:transketolase [Alphaproteobacteria bacterium]